MAKILIIDDEENIRSSLKSALERRGHEIVTAENLETGRRFSQSELDLIFLDVRLPDGNGVDLLDDIIKRRSEQTVVMISGHADIDTAVTAIKKGAFDFIEKPLSLDRVMITIENAIRANRLKDERDRLTSLVYGEFIGNSTVMMKVKDDIILSAPKGSRFLVLGENGSGKELAASMIHRRSKNSEGPFIAVNCAALPSELIESELFGHVKGAFTGAAKDRRGKFVEADQGSIFLDEISEMPSDAQAKILRAIETRTITPVGSEKSVTVDCNIIAASNRNLESLVDENRFRQDLLYRLNVLQFHLPPLRDRGEDIILLAEHFLQRFANETGQKPKQLSAESKLMLKSYNYPGNVRELKNLMERLNIYISGQKIEPDDLSEYLPRIKSKIRISLKEAVLRFESDFIRTAIERNGGNITKTANELGLERSHLYKKIKKSKDI